MSIKIILYIVLSALSIYALSGINFNNFFLKNKIVESRVFIMIIALSLSYLATNFIYDFISILGK